MAYFSETRACFPTPYLETLREQIARCKYLAPNNLTSDFIRARGFSVVFRRTAIEQVKEQFTWLAPYVETLLEADCNAFYLNPLVLGATSRVDPHIDRSLRAYCRTVETPLLVSVLYVTVPEGLRGGELVLRHGKREVGRIVPEVNKVVRFQGDLTHFVTPLGSDVRGERLSVVCEQYDLPASDLVEIPELGLESRGKRY